MTDGRTGNSPGRPSCHQDLPDLAILVGGALPTDLLAGPEVRWAMPTLRWVSDPRDSSSVGLGIQIGRARQGGKCRRGLPDGLGDVLAGRGPDAWRVVGRGDLLEPLVHL